MEIRIAINGYGRIGRNILRAFFERGYDKANIKIVAVNDLADIKTNAHLTRFDSVHGRFNGLIEERADALIVNSHSIQFLSESDPNKLPWAELEIDVVLECTGIFADREAAFAHINAGARKVIISAPAKNADANIVYGVNHHMLGESSYTIISNVSCTTNCLAPIAKVLHENVGIVQGSMTTIHSFTNDQNLHDVYHSDLCRARAATKSMIPTKTGAAQAVGLVLPELEGRLDGMAVRVPTANVSLVDFVFEARHQTTVDEINQVMLKASESYPKGVLKVNQLPLVSIDFNHDPASSIFDTTQTRVNGRLVKVMAWYDNEWGFSNRMLDNTLALMGLKFPPQ